MKHGLGDLLKTEERSWKSALSMQSGSEPALPAEKHGLTYKWPVRVEPPYGCRSAEAR